MTHAQKMRLWAKRVKSDIIAIFYAIKHPKTPLIARIVGGIIVGYALSPIDLIPDFIPVLGYLDDVILIPLGITLVLKLIPTDIMAECREMVIANPPSSKPKIWVCAFLVIFVWIALVYRIYYWIR